MNTPILHETGPEPRDIRTYLRTHGWQRGPRAAEASVWMLPTGQGTYEVIAPSSRAARDFDARLSELLRTLSIVEDRPQEDILDDLYTLRYDIQYIHSEYGGPPGTAPLRDAVSVYSAAQSMMWAIAASLTEPIPVLPRRRSATSTEMMQRVLAGPTSAGSYVISIWTPIPPVLTPDEDPVIFEWPDDPFERRITSLLHAALKSTQNAANNVLIGNTDLSTFIDRAAEGVSANLCEALVALSGDDRTPFDVWFSWALERPVSASDQAIRFDRPSFDVLDDAARDMRSQLPEEDVVIRGYVVRLHREGTRVGPGEVTISGTVQGDRSERLRKIWVSLSEADYGRALEAHRTFAEVELAGSLIQRSSRTYLISTGDFTVRPEDNS